MSRINDMSVSSRFVDLRDIEKNGGATFKLQDKSVTENGTVVADPTYDGLSKVDVNVSGGSSSATAYMWYDPNAEYGGGISLYLDTDIAPQNDELLNVKKIHFDSYSGNLSVGYFIRSEGGGLFSYNRISDTEFKLNGVSYVRGINSDFTLWQLSTSGNLAG